ncbi:glycosyltransferase family 39 protein [Methanolobus sp. ZRKC2]|uniref:glycosyltransferase family 39 protein n=1 Tax=Methanolobus sp. ZRKC2 TaxID=3125783 RepID=UPI00324F3C83
MYFKKIKKYFEKDPYMPFVILVAIVAFVLRIWGITWGIPIGDYSNYYHPDEGKIVNGVFTFPDHIQSNTDLRYPTFYHYSLGILWYPIKAIVDFAINDLNLLYPDGSIDMYLFCFIFVRFFTVLLGTATVLLIYVYSKKIYNSKVAILASIFVTITMFHVQNSSWTTVDVPTAFFLILTLYLANCMIFHRKTSYYLYSAIASGILIGTKYTGGLVIASVIIFHVLAMSKHGELTSIKDIKKIFDKNIILYLFITCIVFLVTTPGAFLKTEYFINSLYYETNRLSINKCSMLELNVWIPHIINHLKRTMGWSLSVVSILGFIYAFHLSTKKPHKELPILLFMGLYFLNLRNVLAARYLIMIAPLFCILAAKFIVDLYESESKTRKAFVSFIAIFIILSSSIYTVQSIQERTTDTRIIASEYISNNIARGSSISDSGYIGNYARWEWNLPRIDSEKYDVKSCFEKPDYIVLTSFRFVPMAKALNSPNLGDNYTWDENYSTMWYRQVIPESEVFLFYDDLLNNKSQKYNYSLVKSFKQEPKIPIEFPAPEIRIYGKNQ